MSIASELVAQFEAERPATRRVLEAVPDGRFDWKPHAKSMSLGKLASHVADIANLAAKLLEPEFGVGEPGKWTPFEPKDRRELLAGHERFANAFRQAFEGRDDAFMQETWRLRKGDKVLWTCKRHEAVRVMVLNHTLHHRGQLTVYLRLLDVPVPSTYGPTADVAV
jgi:uncharacterized damage-inducible protein DinB